MDGPDRVVRFSEIRMEVSIARMDHPSALYIILLGDDRARIHQGRSDGTVAHSEKD